MSTLKVDTITDEAGTGAPTLSQGLTVAGNVSVDGGTIKLDGNYPVGTGNVALGDTALDSVEAGSSDNTTVGNNAGTAITTGQYNTLIGSNAGDALTTSQRNVAIGTGALTTDTLGSRSVAVGQSALGSQNFTSATDTYNTAVGQFAGLSNSTGQYNTFLGGQAGQSNTTASNNTAVGYQAGYSNTTGTENVFIGYQAGKVTTGSFQTIVGGFAGHVLTTGTNNTLVGDHAGDDLTTGSYNCFVGARTSGSTYSGGKITTGSKNTIIGSYNGNQGGLDIRTSSNNIVLSDGDGNPRLLFNSSGNLRVGNFATGSRKVQIESSTANYTLGLENTSTAPYGIYIDYSAASPNGANYEFFVGLDSTATRIQIYSNGNIVNANNSYGAISDVKLKENIIDASSQWDDIKNLTVRKYSLKADNLNAPNMLGVIAQEVEAAGMGGLVFESQDRDADLNDLGTVTKQVNYSILYMKAVKALQEAMDRIETLEADVAALKNS